MIRIVRRISVATAYVVVVVLLLEVCLRILRPHFHGLNVFLYRPSAVSDYDSIDSLEGLLDGTVLGFRPCSEDRGFVLNSRSFRTPEYNHPKAERVRRIVALGDSFTFASGGVPHREMWPARLGYLLNAKEVGPVEVFSLGIPGVGPKFQLRLWEIENRHVDPELVVVGFFVGNDFIDEQSLNFSPNSRPSPAGLSYAYRLVRNLTRVWREGSADGSWKNGGSDVRVLDECGVQIPGMEDQFTAPRQSIDRYLELEARRMQICSRRRRGRFLELSAEVAKVFRRFHEEVRSTGGVLTVMMIPDEFQVDIELRRMVLDHLGESSDDYEIDVPQQRLGEILDEIGVPYLDLLPAFRREAQSRRLYWPRNTHWNQAGHELAANELVSFLEGLLPREPAPGGWNHEN